MSVGSSIIYSVPFHVGFDSFKGIRLDADAFDVLFAFIGEGETILVFGTNRSSIFPIADMFCSSKYKNLMQGENPGEASGLKRKEHIKFSFIQEIMSMEFYLNNDLTSSPAIYVDLDGFDGIDWVAIPYNTTVTYYCRPVKPLNKDKKYLGTRVFSKEKIFDSITALPKLTIALSVKLKISKIRMMHLLPIPEELSLGDASRIHKSLLDHPVICGIHYHLLLELEFGLFEAYIDVVQAPVAFSAITKTTLLDIEWKPEEYQPKPIPAYLKEYCQGMQAYHQLTEIFSKHKGADDIKCVLLCGPNEVGKSVLVQLLAEEYKLSMKVLLSDEISSDVVGETEDTLTEAYTKLNPDSVILIKNVETVAKDQRHYTVKVLKHLINEHKGLSVFTSSRPSMINAKLLNSCKEIVVDPPLTRDRSKFLKLMTEERSITLSDQQLKELGGKTNGYLFKDLQKLVRSSCTGDYAELLQVVKKIEPSLMHDHRVPIQVDITWDDIAGIDEIKKRIRMLVESPITKAEAYKALGLRAPKGILLHGPPGCSKTTIAKAIANAGDYTFYAISGASVYSAYVGESERIVRDTFRNARMTAPSIIFVDEIDTIVGKRANEGGGEGFTDVVQERILSTFLNEMDGVEDLPGDVMVLGATNRLDAIDAAILRPGRFDHIIAVPLPDTNGRMDILKQKTRKMPISLDVNFGLLAEQTKECSGADLAGLVQEAGMSAVREGEMQVEMRHFERALVTLRRERLVKKV